MKNIILLICGILLFSCNAKNAAEAESETKNDSLASEVREDAPVEVRVVRLTESDFSYEILSNGTVAVMNKADLRFQNQEVISCIYVKNGDKVVVGQKLAEQDKFKLQVALAQAQEAKERTYLDLQETLINQGYSINDSAKIPSEVMRLARIRSGYEQSENNYRMAAYNLREATLRAPFAGTVANLTAKAHNLPDGNAFCTIVDNSRPEVVFNILESELPAVKKGDKALVSPFSQPDVQATGTVTEINPLVDKNGMVRIKAVINGNKQYFYEGMNVKVRIQRLLGKALVIPKPALTLRTNRKVVFTAKNNLAQWNYVETAQENSDSYVVTSGLSVGDSVIISGNINLAHETAISITN
ncbi:MAG: efflux RND transporter periplasmic adaptor subunit [Prevotellaceae bacterium]|jgi:RND family efflux transporter MFP subunit|nr:efflux RND transporter periplasmic adaptor subunit [Prevotellaceae bacterium]